MPNRHLVWAVVAAAGCADVIDDHASEASVVRLSTLVTGNPAQNLTIAAGTTVLIDTDADLARLAIHGVLKCPLPGTGTSFTIKADAIMVHGAGARLSCGVPGVSRFLGKLEILLQDGASFGDGQRALSVMDGGTLELFGRAKNSTWQRVSATVDAGSRTVTVPQQVDNWSRGDRIVLGSTSWNFAEAEERVITAVSEDRRTITVDVPFAYRHYGVTHTFAGKQLDERAEVANLTRSIVIAPDGPTTASGIGSHVMIMAGGTAHIDGVEFRNGGQAGLMGRYPIHWHLVGDASGQFLRNSSIHHSHQRCVTLHRTNNAVIENNVCFDHRGHGFFLENGDEVGNTLAGNLGMLSRRVDPAKALLFSDATSNQPQRFHAPATFWITNPRNTIRGNVASGSQGTGFWMAFAQGMHCPLPRTESCRFPEPGYPANVFPAREATLEFADNVAHSSFVGMNWDGAEVGPIWKPDGISPNPNNPTARETDSSAYDPPVATSFPDLVMFKNLASGIYFRGRTVTFPRLVAADNAFSLFFAYNQIVTNGLVVGASPSVTVAELEWARSSASRAAGWFDMLRGVRIYDGPFELRGVHFARFDAASVPTTLPAVPFDNLGGAGRAVNKVSGLTFSAVGRRMQLGGEFGWFETPWTTAIHDLDGSLAGTPDRMIVPLHALNNVPAACALAPADIGGRTCAYDFGVLSFQDSAGADPTFVPFAVTRIHDAQGTEVRSDAPIPETANHNKTGIVIHPAFSYRIAFTAPVPAVISMTWKTERNAMLSPVIQFTDYRNCRIAGAQLTSLADLRDSTEQAYFRDASGLYVRLKSTTPINGAFHTKQVRIECP